jgi:hypothetical protein
MLQVTMQRPTAWTALCMTDLRVLHSTLALYRYRWAASFFIRCQFWEWIPSSIWMMTTAQGNAFQRWLARLGLAASGCFNCNTLCPLHLLPREASAFMSSLLTKKQGDGLSRPAGKRTSSLRSPLSQE